MTDSTQVDDEIIALGTALIGTWDISGGTQGQIRYEWMEGGFFLIQHIDLGDNKGMEIIGRERLFGASEASVFMATRVKPSIMFMN